MYALDLLTAALGDVGLSNRRVGIEAGLSQRIRMPYCEYTGLLQSFPEVRFVDAAPLIWKMRMVKSEEEIGHMKRAAEITGHARQKCFDKIAPGSHTTRLLDS